MRYLDIAPAPDAVVATRILKNTCCINGSYFEKDTTKQNAVGSIHHRTIDSFVTNDTIQFQVASTDTTVRFGYNCTVQIGRGATKFYRVYCLGKDSDIPCKILNQFRTNLRNKIIHESKFDRQQ